MDIRSLQKAIQSGRLEWQRHALEKMAERNISRSMVLNTMLHGEMIEDYPKDRPLPSALFLGFSENVPLHVVVAFDSQASRAYVITAYEPDPTRFESDFKTRRKI